MRLDLSLSASRLIACAQGSSVCSDSSCEARANAAALHDRSTLRPKSFPVTMSEGPYPIPSRTRKSSPPEPMVLRARVRGRVGRCQVYLQSPEAPKSFGAFPFRPAVSMHGGPRSSLLARHVVATETKRSAESGLRADVEPRSQALAAACNQHGLTLEHHALATSRTRASVLDGWVAGRFVPRSAARQCVGRQSKATRTCLLACTGRVGARRGCGVRRLAASCATTQDQQEQDI